MNIKSIIDIITSSLTTIAVIFTLTYTIITNYRNKKEQKELKEEQKKREIQQSYSEINKLLVDTWQEYKNFNLKNSEFCNEKWNYQLNIHLSKYIFEVKNTLLPYNIPHNLPIEHKCMQCEKKFSTSEWNKLFLKPEINQRKIKWEMWFRINLIQKNYYEFEILSGICPKCLEAKWKLTQNK